MKITGFSIVDELGKPINGDAHGNNLAFICRKCGHPILAIARSNQRGSAASHPAICKGCKSAYFLTVNESTEQLAINIIPKYNEKVA